ncbi:MAG: hypothetical protein OEZ01_07500 [Candidatus Heimdallarchaeota archaeon]|nr:hypothetical protein [Candidatus Heimdallarchaeota archaeon]
MKRLSVEAKLRAYNTAINDLKGAEVDQGDDMAEEEMAAMRWLANKLDRECQRWYNLLKKT